MNLEPLRTVLAMEKDPNRKNLLNLCVQLFKASHWTHFTRMYESGEAAERLSSEVVAALGLRLTASMRQRSLSGMCFACGWSVKI